MCWKWCPSDRREKSLALLTQNFVKLFVCSNLEMISLDDAARLLLGDAYNSSTIRTVGDRYYKVAAEALRVRGELVSAVRPNIEGSGFDFRPYVHPIYNGILSSLINHDQEQEVKECAISCMGLIVSTFGHHLNAELAACLPVLVDRMGNEITRVTAVKVDPLNFVEQNSMNNCDLFTNPATAKIDEIMSAAKFRISSFH
ncbi:E2F transcription factor E2FE [Trifolium repens]|nr:E2F transcription factor E2FE [Trifolium repens]